VNDQDLLDVYDSWTLAYYYTCLSNPLCDHPPDALPNQEVHLPDEDEDEFEDLEDEEDLNLRQQTWMREAGRHPNAPAELDLQQTLGFRDQDLAHNWLANPLQPDEQALALNWISQQQREWGNNADIDIPQVDWRQLQGYQRQIFLQVIAYLRAVLDPDPARDKPQPLCLNVDGTAGTGKSFLIAAICTEVRSLMQHYGWPDPIVLVAPTGIAAYGIHGLTIHTAFSISPRHWAALRPGSAHRLQNKWKDIKLLIVDEKSMVGQNLLGKVDRRLCEFFPDKADVSLAGMAVLLFGDFAQLPPVGDRCLFLPASNLGSSGLSQDGRRAYESFTQSVTLQQVFRQAGQDPQSEQFREALLHMRTYAPTHQDYELLSSRFKERLPQEEQNTFKDALRLIPTRSEVEVHNLRQLANLGNPVVCCPARHTGGREASSATEEDAEGLEKEILLAEGARVMLTKNLWTSQGMSHPTFSILCSGSSSALQV
jgi:hypothetical protein